jgi:hypothetical protein
MNNPKDAAAQTQCGGGLLLGQTREIVLPESLSLALTQKRWENGHGHTVTGYSFLNLRKMNNHISHPVTAKLSAGESLPNRHAAWPRIVPDVWNPGKIDTTNLLGRVRFNGLSVVNFQKAHFRPTFYRTTANSPPCLFLAQSAWHAGLLRVGEAVPPKLISRNVVS